jgi:hypothetical protein
MIAGITGHRKFENVEWVKSAIQQLIKSENVTYGFTCLATGADELFAEILRFERIGYTAIIPSYDYEKTFSVEELKVFLYSKNNAQKIIELNNSISSEKAFNEAGKAVIDFSDVLIAVWDGKKAKGLGGTGDVVKYAKENNRNIIHINPIKKSIKQLEYGKH